MADQWVLASQRWLNKTFGSVSGWTKVAEDGNTGQGTVNGLIEGLQALLGISPVVPSFGPTTWTKLQAHGNVDGDDSTKWVTLVQAALYCKGYSGASLDGKWADTLPSVKQLSADLGLGSSVTGLTPKTFRALLTTDPAVKIAGGTDAARAAQQYLNATYGSHTGFYYNATGGVFDRSTQQNLVRGIQYELGQTDSAADGAFGPGTGGQLKANSTSVVRVGSTGRWVALFKAALIFNGYPVTFNSTFTATDSAAAKRFQQFEGFTSANQSGIGDYATWAELIVSTGDPNRPGTGADMASTITAARAQSLKAAGYTIVGRYLTNEQATNPLDKKIKPGELQTIFDAGLRLFPIFEEGGYQTSWFSAAQGAKDAQRAYDAAKAYGIPGGTIIYFAVDVDVIEAEVRADVVPYFAALNTKMNQLGGTYGIGIYGARNTCAIISDAGLARTSYISGLSTGFSGNLGYPLPTNWAFNQIQTLTIGSGTGAVEIDKNIVSGRDSGISSVSTPDSAFAGFFSWLDTVQAYAQQWYSSGNATTTPNRLVLQYMRYPSYGSGEGGDSSGAIQWSVVAGQLDLGFIQYMEDNNVGRVDSFVEPSPFQVKMGPQHLAAAIDSLLQHPISSNGAVTVGEGGGWAGDLVQFVGTWVPAGRPEIGQYTQDNLASNDASGFGIGDLFEDIDGWLIATVMRGSGVPTNVAIRNHYSAGGGCSSRFPDFYDARLGGTYESAAQKAYEALESTEDSLYTAFRIALYENYAKSTYTYTSEEASKFAEGFVLRYNAFLSI
ncbi:glycoside hydrolase domain-containing protein [Curtobacterium sp. VKM Ac-1376]|uniref:glycoside hydrolase domain-containing protein n=1 Tax=Curtobacterium sp. VKM Ac-1376 TaxID=123312 RepID=UPI00188D39E6|nr:glycoside hydrolase domain-containing protein [Curtobacterium sp. VKM Ac-1376]MBF4615489.1 DUF1906 domain-containing protein [Curtobacterium sp. VKM Ac-1376]